MKFAILLSFILGMAFTSKAQDNFDTSNLFNVIYVPIYYKERGVVFNRSYNIGIEMKNMQFRFSPTKGDIINTEKILIDKYNAVQKSNVDVKKFFCHWVRQYAGFIDNNGNKNIIVQLINNSKSRKINRLLGKDWQKDFVIMLSDSFYNVSKFFRINIDTSEMTN